METDFLKTFNKRQQDEQPHKKVKPFLGNPSLLSLADRQELIYKFQYLEASIESLALHYRLTPLSLEHWLDDNNITRQELETEEDTQNFEKRVTETYKSIQTRLLGLTVHHSAKAWHSLALIEEDLLASLENAAKSVSEQETPDHRTIASLASTHEKLVQRHKIIQEGLDSAKDGGLFQAITKIERTIVKPKQTEENKEKEQDE